MSGEKRPKPTLQRQGSELTSEKIAELREAFDHIDVDKDGHITPQEMKVVLRQVLNSDITDEDVMDVVRDADLNQDGSIDFGEFVVMMKKQEESVQSEELRAAFEAFDVNGDGVITFDEFRDVMHKLDDKITDAEIQDLITSADKNGDGHITFEEFVAAMWQK
eukprot:CAMPEP_0184336380 /NCGR_PEP_ID=MMETSP1089-20130417/4698_1 /TAXON_ID=38269 ORGANISM="Gloeochaete wittrockiana, Strain SAG46.84" /NCGR_SAMPLE_ID=MMETSP1089 /ASSEMBLY_ACC=CAM_ASM_000445 /LENGTH=162 /DNA_ID=CAMNT_0026661387 /DNA_START=90 /DNA_END=578 /DNA_ORIENTATION=+